MPLVSALRNSIGITTTEKVADLLGGRPVFRRQLSKLDEMDEALRKGLPFAAFEALRGAIEVRPGQLSGVLGVAKRTLARRKAGGRFTTIESDRLFRVAYIAQKASETLGSLDKARAWLQTGNRAFGGRSPISKLDTEIGEREVEDQLNRINFGIYS